jgi:hypothetical protein
MSLLINVFKYTLGDAILSVFYFPFWWYTIGLKKRLLEFGQGIRKLSHQLALKLMLIHIFKPMFGESSWKGRIISFFMRLILLGWRFFRFLIGSLFRFCWLIIWIILPILSLWQIIKLIG